LRPTHLGLNPNRRRRRLSLGVLTSGDKQGRNTTTPWRFEIRFLSRTRETKRAKLFTRNEYHAFTLRDWRERSVVTHRARAKNAHHRATRAGEGGKQSEKREIHHPKKKKEKSFAEIRAR
jgi:hypothetical protein